MMIPEMMERGGVGNSGKPGTFAQRHGVRTLGSYKAVYRVKKRLPKLAVMVSLFLYRHIQNSNFLS
jgi:hypothetical protein